MTGDRLERLADELLLIIRQKPRTPFTHKLLARRLKTGRDEIDAAMKLLAGWDYRLTLSNRRGISFITAPDYLTSTEIGYRLKTARIGKSIHAFKSVKSTNDLAALMAEGGAPEGTVVTAEEQTRGRGRLGRNWHSPAGTGIYVSIILRPKFKPERAPGLSIVTALALADVLNSYCPEDVQIKWPNDLLIRGRKVAGILTELSAERDRISHVIVGVGINVNQGVGNFPDELRQSASSLRRVLKRKINRVELLQRFLLRLEKEYAAYRSHGLKKAHARVKKLSSLLGNKVTVKTGTKRLTGRAVDIDKDGRLVLETDDGRIAITAGEVTVVKG